MNLHEAQSLLFEFVTGVDGAEATVARTGLDPRRFVAEGGRLSPLERLDVFAEDYGARILNTLREVFPRTERHLGERAFVDLVYDYLQAHPPRRPSLRYLGAELPGFSASHRLAEERPALGGLCRLEWLLHDLYDVADEPVLTRADLAALSPDAWSDLPLRLVRAQARFDAPSDVGALWSALETEGAEPEHPHAPTQMLVWRWDERVWFRSLEPLEDQLLGALAGGTTLSELSARLGADMSVDEAVAKVLPLLARWVEDGLLARP